MFLCLINFDYDKKKKSFLPLELKPFTCGTSLRFSNNTSPECLSAGFWGFVRARAFDDDARRILLSLNIKAYYNLRHWIEREKNTFSRQKENDFGLSTDIFIAMAWGCWERWASPHYNEMKLALLICGCLEWWACVLAVGSPIHFRDSVLSGSSFRRIGSERVIDSFTPLCIYVIAWSRRFVLYCFIPTFFD